jgi:hypothetical protein
MTLARTSCFLFQMSITDFVYWRAVCPVSWETIALSPVHAEKRSCAHRHDFFESYDEEPLDFNRIISMAEVV